MNLDPIERCAASRVAVGAFRADDHDVPTSVSESDAFRPDASVGWNGVILNEDECCRHAG
jgi:hypothetical protein